MGFERIGLYFDFIILLVELFIESFVIFMMIRIRIVVDLFYGVIMESKWNNIWKNIIDMLVIIIVNFKLENFIIY